MIKLKLPYPVNASGIYKIVDVETGRFYIGSSVNIEKRWHQHRGRLSRGTHPNPILQAIWSKSQDRLHIETIQFCEPIKDELLRAEQAFLDEAGVGSNRLCMNVLSVAGSHLGRKRSELTCARLSVANTGKHPSLETRAKQRAAKLNKKQTLQHRINSANARRGMKINRKKGGANPKVRIFNPDQIIEMRNRKSSGESYSKIEAAMKVSHGGLQKILSRTTYSDIT